MAIMTKDLGKKNIKSTIDRLMQQGDDVFDLLLIDSTERYEQALAIMEHLVLEADDSSQNPYHRFMVLLGESIQRYEQTHFPMEESSPVEIIRFLMEEHGLTQSDLPEVGNQAKVSEVLSGKRSLNVRQVKALSERFNISPALLIE
jgi:HTH-type transcriptional regulator/antitoxin HigA